MEPYDPIEDLSDHVRRLAEVWANMGLDYHPAYATALEAVDRAARFEADKQHVQEVAS